MCLLQFSQNTRMASMSYTATLERDSRVTFVDYTWIISGILYQGGTDALVPELMSRGINEVYFHNVAGTPIGKKNSIRSG